MVVNIIEKFVDIYLGSGWKFGIVYFLLYVKSPGINREKEKKVKIKKEKRKSFWKLEDSKDRNVNNGF